MPIRYLVPLSTLIEKVMRMFGNGLNRCLLSSVLFLHDGDLSVVFLLLVPSLTGSLNKVDQWKV